MSITKKCGNPDCTCSTGIHDGLTFGSGNLDDHGYFEKPCRICAKEHDETVNSTKEDVINDLRRIGRSQKEIEDYLKDADWLRIPAWPFEDTKL
jgi:hypothetical protein